MIAFLGDADTFETMEIATLKEIGHRLRAARERSTVTVRELAQLVDVKPSTIHRWENGEVEGGCREISLIGVHLGEEPNSLLLGENSATESGLSEEGMRNLSTIYFASIELAKEVDEQLLADLAQFLTGFKRRWDSEDGGASTETPPNATIPPGTVIEHPEPGFKTMKPPIRSAPLRAKRRLQNEGIGQTGVAGEASTPYGLRKRRRKPK